MKNPATGKISQKNWDSKQKKPPSDGNMYDGILSQKKLEYNQKLQFDVVLGTN